MDSAERSMHAFDVVGDPVRRRVLELLAEKEKTSGEIVAVIQREHGISQAAVSQHLKVLRESGFATVRRDGARRIYSVDAEPLQEIDQWLDRFRRSSPDELQGPQGMYRSMIGCSPLLAGARGTPPNMDRRIGETSRPYESG